MKKFFLLLLVVMAVFSFTACGKKEHSHSFVEHKAVSATCVSKGNDEYFTCSGCDKIFDANKAEISAIPTTDFADHNYILQDGSTASCSVKGVEAHYTCDTCDKLFDLSKQEIDSVEATFDKSNHSASAVLVITASPEKTAYQVGETFDVSGAVVLSKCSDCDGFIIDNQFLNVVYQTENATSFSIEDTKVTLTFNGLSVDVEVEVSKKQAIISGVLDSYETTCGVAPEIKATVNDGSVELKYAYFDGDSQIDVSSFKAGNTYTVKVFVESTESIIGAEKTATITVSHGHGWYLDETVVDRINYGCKCGDGNGVYVINNVIQYVDSVDMAIDFSKLVFGTDGIAVNSVKKVTDSGEVDLTPASVDGLVYTFALEDYNLTEYTPYELPLVVELTVDGHEIKLNYFSKYIEKVIRTAEDLKVVMYKGDHGATIANVPHPATQITGYYALANDIDATDLVIDSNFCFVSLGGFCGVFDGNGYTISNLTLTKGSNGLFGGLGYGAKVRDVTFDSVTVLDDKVTSDNGTFVLAYAIRNTTLTDVTVNFSEYSLAYKLAREANDSVFENVEVTVEEGEEVFFVSQNSNSSDIVYNYFDRNALVNSIIAQISDLPNSVTMPDHAYFLPRILEVKNAYDRLTVTVKEQITNYSKLESLLKDISGYNVVLTQNLDKVSVIPAYVPNYTSTVGGTATFTNDELYGKVLSVKSAVDGKVSLLYENFSAVNGYEKIYFFVKVSVGCDIYLSDGTQNDGWGADWKNTWDEEGYWCNENVWRLVEFDVSKGYIGTDFALGFRCDAVGFSFEITDIYGVKKGAKKASISFGNIVDSGVINENGAVYNLTQGWASNTDLGAFNVGSLASALNEGHDSFRFYIYNPNASDVTLYVMENNTWIKTDIVVLKANTWTEVVLDSSIVQANKNNLFFMCVSSGAGTSGWQISDIYSFWAD